MNAMLLIPLFKLMLMCAGQPRPSPSSANANAHPGAASPGPCAPPQPGPRKNPGPGPAIRHIVLFRYRQDVTPAQREEVVRRFVALRHTARLDGKPYIAALEHGPQASLEQAGKGFQDGFILTFRSMADRDYYVGLAGPSNPARVDPRHAAFKRFVARYLADVLVFDIALPEPPAGCRAP